MQGKNILLGIILMILNLFLPESFEIENLAVRRKAYQSSLFVDNNAYGAYLAVDGDLSQNWLKIATTGHQNLVYWYVDLGDLRNIYNVTIYYRTDSNLPASSGYRSFVERFSGFSLFISTTNHTSKDGYDCGVNSTSPPLIYQIPCAAVGRYVTIYNEREDGTAILDLAEVQVFGCNNTDEYGEQCNFTCHSHCLNSQCNAESGSCFSCVDGFTGSYCHQKCPGGSYGKGCLSNCSVNCLDPSSCDHVNGSCACRSGWEGEYCNKACKEGTYGPNCRYVCGHCEYGSLCDRSSGDCTYSCKPGYYPPKCVDKCSDGFYGENCSKTCTGNCQNNETCNFVNGHCPNNCAEGWISPKCDAECLPNSYGRQCLLNCTENCNGTCHHVTGICKEGCVKGFHGQMCSEKCSASCKNDSSCRQNNGSCYDCNPGFYGSECTMIFPLTSDVDQAVPSVKILFGVFIVIRMVTFTAVLGVPRILTI